MKIFLVVEDYGFYSEDQWGYCISLEDINGRCHSKVHFAGSSREAAEKVLNEMIKCEEEDWDTKAKETTIRNTDGMITGYYILGSFYYIQEVELE